MCRLLWLRLAGSACLGAAGILLRLNLLRLVGDAGRQVSDALLELAVLGGVDERIDTAADEHQNHGEVIEPTDKIIKNKIK